MGIELKGFEDTIAIILKFLILNEVKALIKEWYRKSSKSSYLNHTKPSFKESRETIDNKFEEAERINVGLVEKYKIIPNIEISLLLLS